MSEPKAKYRPEEALVAEFVATLPPIQSAVSVSGHGEGARIKLDIPGSDLIEALKLTMIPGVLLRVVIYKVE